MNSIQNNEVININKESSTMFLESIGPRLKKLRDKRGLEQSELARIAGVSQSLISKIECGAANPSLRTLISLADALGVKVGYFTSGDDSSGK